MKFVYERLIVINYLELKSLIFSTPYYELGDDILYMSRLNNLFLLLRLGAGRFLPESLL